MENADNAFYTTPEPIRLGASYRYLRFYVLHTTSARDYFNLCQLQLYQGKGGPSARAKRLQSQLKALDALCTASAAKVANEQATQADVIALRNAILAFRIDKYSFGDIQSVL